MTLRDGRFLASELPNCGLLVANDIHKSACLVDVLGRPLADSLSSRLPVKFDDVKEQGGTEDGTQWAGVGRPGLHATCLRLRLRFPRFDTLSGSPNMLAVLIRLIRGGFNTSAALKLRLWRWLRAFR